MEYKPVNYITYLDAIRYVNWLSNDSGDTESGSYTITGNSVSDKRSDEAKYFIPNENEWFKAAYYNGPVGVTRQSLYPYWLYATQSSTDPYCPNLDANGDGPCSTEYSCFCSVDRIIDVTLADPLINYGQVFELELADSSSSCCNVQIKLNPSGSWTDVSPSLVDCVGCVSGTVSLDPIANATTGGTKLTSLSVSSGQYITTTGTGLITDNKNDLINNPYSPPPNSLITYLNNNIIASNSYLDSEKVYENGVISFQYIDNDNETFQIIDHMSNSILSELNEFINYEHSAQSTNNNNSDKDGSWQISTVACNSPLDSINTNKTIQVAIPTSILRVQNYTSVCFRVGGCCQNSASYSNTVCALIPPIPEPEVSISNINVTEANTTNPFIQIPVTLDDPYIDTVTIEYKTEDMEAFEADPDYIGQTGILTYAPGEITKNIILEIVADTKVENHERFKVVLTKAINAKLNNTDGIVTIINDDSPLPPPPPPGPCVGSLDISGFRLDCDYIHDSVGSSRCPGDGSHVCNRAIFDIYINEVFVGQANLNNLSGNSSLLTVSRYNRYSNFTIPAGVAATTNNEYKIEIRAAASNRNPHRGIARISITDLSGKVIFASCLPNDKAIFIPACI
jgi:hypothetical protein